MLNLQDKKEIIKTGLVLFLITAVSASLLAIVNTITEPIIAENEEMKKQAAMIEVLPDADSFGTENLYTPNDEKDIVSEIYKANNDTGYVVMTSPKGYGGEIKLAVGVSADYKVTGVSVITQSETAGLGSKCTDAEFLSQFKDKEGNISVVKNGADKSKVNAISSATITSKAVTLGVNSAIKAAKLVKGVE